MDKPLSSALSAFLLQLHSMPDSVCRSITEAFRLKSWRTADTLIREGTTASYYHLVAKGYARSFTIDTDGREVTTDFFGPFDIATDLSSLFMRKPAQESFEAIGPLATWSVSFEELNGLFHAEPHFRELGRALLVRCHAKLHARTVAALHERADVRYAKLMKTSPDLILHAPLKQIASYLGVTDSSLSRIRREFAGGAIADLKNMS